MRLAQQLVNAYQASWASLARANDQYGLQMEGQGTQAEPMAWLAG